jgi:nucleoside-diphosphate-sugar epimerase
MYHFAWNGTRGEDRNNEEMQMLNVENSLSTLKAARKIGCKTFFTSGSQAEYGIQSENVNENAKCQPVTAYGKAKLNFYEIAKDYCQKNNIRLVEPRIFSLYGPGDFKQSLIMSTISKMKENADVELSSCMQLWNYLYINDAVNALILLNENEKAEGVFNLASDDTRVLKDFILDMKDVLQTDSKIIFGEQTPSGINPDITKLKNTIDWQEQYTFKDGIKEISDSFR